MRVNNTIFERKHHYMYILKESEILKRQMNEELMDGNIEASRLDEISAICNYAFAGLIQEGLEYQYSKDTDSRKDTLIITVDHVDYKCRVSVLKHILGEKYQDYIAEDYRPLKREPEPVIDITPVAKAPAPTPEPVYEAPSVKEEPVPHPEESVFNNMIGEVMGTIPQEDVSVSVPAPSGEVITDKTEDIADKVIEGIIEETINAEKNIPDESLPAEEIAPVPQEDTIAEEAEQYADAVTESATPYLPDTAEDDVPNIRPMVTGSLFIEERNKPKDTFMFETQRIMAMHEGVSKGDEIFFTIAPLEIKKDCVSVPIIVYAFLRGKHYCVSSLDNEDKNKALVKLALADYEFLIRGMIDENGKFSANIFTAGISTSQNDQINIIDRRSYNPPLSKVKNGHVKFEYDSVAGEKNMLEVFPVSMEENQFFILKRSGEWIDYYCTENVPKIVIQTKSGMEELICLWENNILRTEFVPA